MGDTWEDSNLEERIGGLNLNAQAKEWKPSWLGGGAAAPAPAPTPAPAAVAAEATTEAAEQVVEEDVKPAVEQAVEPEVAVAADPQPTVVVEEAAPKEEEAAPAEAESETVAEAVEEEVEEELAFVDEEAALKELEKTLDPRDHLNVVFIGHVDAGKSTLSGSILYSMGAVDKRTIEKYEREAKDRNRESWFLAFIMDTNEEERAKGKTVEVGRAHFETEQKRYTILDAPGHKNYVPAMITGASQADVGILVISARKGEFEAGFDRLGQTREHALLAKTLGVQKLIVVINKMDESTVKWSKERFDQCVKKLTPYLKNECYYKVKKDVTFIPISAYTGANIVEPVTKDVCEWATEMNNNMSLIQILDKLTIAGRDPHGSVRIPILDSYNDRGTIAIGKVEAGTLVKGQKIQAYPSKAIGKVEAILNNGEEVDGAKPGENVHIKLKQIDEEQVQKGFVLSSVKNPVRATSRIVGQIVLLDLMEHRPIFTAGYTAVLHAHTAIEECTVTELLKEIDLKTKRPLKRPPTFAKSGSVIIVSIELNRAVCLEAFKNVPQLGRFTLRDEGKSIAIGKVLKVE